MTQKSQAQTFEETQGSSKARTSEEGNKPTVGNSPLDADTISQPKQNVKPQNKIAYTDDNRPVAVINKDILVGVAKGDVLMRIGNSDYKAEVIVGITKSGKDDLYDVINLTPDNLVLKNKLPGYSLKAISPRL